jgi:hypothetical protein
MSNDIKLVVVHPFGQFSKGDEITDKDFIKEILDETHENHYINSHVVKVQKNEKQKEIVPTQKISTIKS